MIRIQARRALFQMNSKSESDKEGWGIYSLSNIDMKAHVMAPNGKHMDYGHGLYHNGTLRIFEILISTRLKVGSSMCVSETR